MTNWYRFNFQYLNSKNSHDRWFKRDLHFCFEKCLLKWSEANGSFECYKNQLRGILSSLIYTLWHILFMNDENRLIISHYQKIKCKKSNEASILAVWYDLWFNKSTFILWQLCEIFGSQHNRINTAHCFHSCVVSTE